MNEEVQLFWHRFIEKNHLENQSPYSVFYFCLTEELANELLELVLKGKKKATSSSIKAYEIDHQPYPQVGDYSIVTDFKGKPYCVIKTTNITILPFKEMTFDLAKIEGEDDNLESWQDGHRRFFTLEGKEMGYEFNEDMLVIFEEFEVVYQEDK